MVVFSNKRAIHTDVTTVMMWGCLSRVEFKKKSRYSWRNAGYGTRQHINFISLYRRISFCLKLFSCIHFRSVAAIHRRRLQEYLDISSSRFLSL